jgi:hypothetical protein
MKKQSVKINFVYNVNIRGYIRPVRIDRESQFGGWEGTNLLTMRKVRIRTAARLRSECDQSLYRS